VNSLKKIKKNEIVSKLAKKLSKLLMTEAEEIIDEISRETKERQERRKEKIISSLPILFAAQLRTLRAKGVPEEIIKQLSSKKAGVLREAKNLGQLGYRKKTIIFLPIIPRHCLSLAEQLNLLGISLLTGSETIADQTFQSEKPYYIFMVDISKRTKGEMLPGVRKIINQANKVPLNIEEGLSLTLHSKILAKNQINLLGSKILGNEDDHPLIFHDGVSSLSASKDGNRKVFWIFPSRNKEII